MNREAGTKSELGKTQIIVEREDCHPLIGLAQKLYLCVWIGDLFIRTFYKIMHSKIYRSRVIEVLICSSHIVAVLN